MDVYSFGLLCFWLIFEKYLSGVAHLPPNLDWAKEHFQCEEVDDLALSILEDIKQKENLVRFARDLTMAEKGLEDQQKVALESFFKASLNDDPNEREGDVKGLISGLRPNL
jgi:hypothetical protein